MDKCNGIIKPNWVGDTSDRALARALNIFWETHKKFILYEVMPYRDMYGFGGDLNWLLLTDNEFRRYFIRFPDTIKLKLNDKLKLEWVK